MSEKQGFKSLLKIALCVSIVWHPLCYYLDYMFEDLDLTSKVLLGDKFSYIHHAVRWDSVFFLENGVNGYRFEKNHVFLPGFPLIIKTLQLISDAHYLYLVLLVQEICNIVSLYLLWKITLMVTNNHNYSYITGLTFIFSPGSAFFHSVYSETFFTLFSFFGVYIYYKYLELRQPIKASIFSALVFGFSIFIRSTGLFFISVSGYPILYDSIRDFKNDSFKEFFHNFLTKRIPLGLLIIIIFFIPYFCIIYYPYRLYCYNEIHSSWCDNLIPNIYEYIQSTYWEVGFLSQYNWDKLGLIALGMIALVSMGNWLFRVTYQIFVDKSKKNLNLRIFDDRITPLLIYQFILFIVTAFFAFVNCATRFFSVTVPFYWCLSSTLTFQSNKNKNLGVNFFQFYTLFYLIYFNIGGLIQFTNHLIWF